MIKTALKHWIFELCIEQLFENISKNFIDTNQIPTNFKIGDRFRYIKCIPKKNRSADGVEIISREFYNCECIHPTGTNRIANGLLNVKYKEFQLLYYDSSIGKDSIDRTLNHVGFIVVSDIVECIK